MTRKKSRPTHRENAATVPPNEGGFYKMFWNSMDNSGTNGPNSPAQDNVTSPVIIIDDSPSGSPCANENSCDNLVIPRPIKEEILENAVENFTNSETSPENVQDSHFGIKINGDCSSSHQKCLTGNSLTSLSKNSSPPFPQTHPATLENSPQIAHSDQITRISTQMTRVGTSAYGNDSPKKETGSEIFVYSDSPQETTRTEEDGIPVEPVEDNKVGDQVTAEERVECPEIPYVTTVIENPEEISSDHVNSASHCVENSGDTPVSDEGVSHNLPVDEAVLVETPMYSEDIPAEADVVFPCELPGSTLPVCTNEKISEETRMDISESQSPFCSHVNYEETPIDEPPTDDIHNEFSTLCNEENVDDPSKGGLGLEGTLNLLQKLLNAPDEEINATLNKVPGLSELVGGQQDISTYPNVEQMDEFEPTQGSSCHGSVNVSSMENEHSITMPENVLQGGENVTADGPHLNETETVVDKEEEFPTFGSNFLPKKIKLDSVGIVRSVRFLKEQVRALYKEYLKDDVILRTVCEPQAPVEEESELADEVEETITLPSASIPYPICCVKMERLPDPFVKKSTVAMSDDTFKTWKRQIIRQRNEEKFRHLKVWRRGRTLLWRECELAGMDRATYNEQVAYVNKHKLNETSSSDSDSSGDESGHDASPCHNDTSGESSEEEGISCEDDEVSSVDLSSSPMKLNASETRSITPPHSQPESTADTHLPGDEYIVESTTAGQSSTTKAPAALKITIRKASLSKSEEDKEKPPEEEENFTVSAYPTFHKSRKIATKRTFRRPSELSRSNLPSKSAAVDTKKSKPTPVEEEDLYDQSLLGRRSYEVENFNLLEKWDIPFEEPTLFRSPRAASRLAQLKTKEAFAPVLKRHAPQKTTAGATATSNTITVSREVKEVVEMLCSKTVEAVLFPESRWASPKKSAKTNDVKTAGTKAAATHNQPDELPSKPLVPSEETKSNLDDSAEMALSETSSTRDASSDFGGSATSLLSEDLPPTKKSTQKARRRRRMGPAWSKKKKVKGKAVDGQHVNDSSERDQHSTGPIDVPVQPVEQSVAGKVGSENEKSKQELSASHAHSTQVPVVSEGPGQSPHESEEDSAQRIKKHTSKNETTPTLTESAKNSQLVAEKTNETLPEELQPNKETQEEVVPPRLTRSKQPAILLDPELLENFGTRKRKPKTDLLYDVSQDEGSKKPKQPDTKKTSAKNEMHSVKSTRVPEEANSTVIDKVLDDDSNTQVPEVSEGPGEVVLDEDKQDQENKVEVEKPPFRMLRSRSRPPPTKSTTSTVQESTGTNQKTQNSAKVDVNKTDNKNKFEELVLESPASPPPETFEPEPLINSRITRSKKRRSGPAYVAVKSTEESALPSAFDIVDSVAGHRLPLSKLFDTSLSSSPPEPVSSFRAQTSSESALFIDEKDKASSVIELGQQQTVDKIESLQGKPIHSPPEGTCLNSKQNHVTARTLTDFVLADEPVGKSVEEIPVRLADQTELPTKSTVDSSTCLQVQENQSAAVDVGLPTAAVDGESASGAAGMNENLMHGKLSPEKVGSAAKVASLEVLNIVNSMKESLAAASPAKVSTPISTVSSPLSSDSLQAIPMDISPQRPSVSNISYPVGSTSSLPAFPTSAQDISSILPGTFLSTLFNSTLDTNLTTYSNESNDPSLADDPGDLVIDESANELDVNFFDNLTNADLSKADDNDFSDDDNNTDLADKIDKIVKDQIYQDPVPVPSLTPKKANSSDGKKAQEESPDKSVTSLRRDSIDEKTGLPTNFIQRLRDPRIRNRLLSHLEQEETNDKTPQSSLATILGCLPVSDSTSSTIGPLAAKTGSTEPQRKVESAAVNAISCPSVSSTVSSFPSPQVPEVSPALTQPVAGVQLEAAVTAGIAGQLAPLSSTLVLTTPMLQPGTPGQQPLVTQDSPIQSVGNFDKPEEPPDPSKVDFLVPPSDDEDEECIKRRPKKAKKEVDVELMYKSPLEDLQSEARPAYGERGPRRYGENFLRRRSDDRRPRWDDRRSRIDDARDSRPSRDRSRGRYEEQRRDRSLSRDRRAYYDRPPRDQSRDRRAHDPYMESPNQPCRHPSSPWPVGDPAFNHHQVMMQHPEAHHWQQNFYAEPNIPPHLPLFGPEPPKIDYMETRLINLELLPKTTNLQVPPDKKVYDYFNKENVQMLQTPPPVYDPTDEPEPLRVLDPVTEEMVEIPAIPRPTSGLTKEFFRHVPPDLTLADVVKFHFISPAYVMVLDNEEDLWLSSDEEDRLNAKHNEKHLRKQEYKKRPSKSSLEHNLKRDTKRSLENQKQDSEPDWHDRPYDPVHSRPSPLTAHSKKDSVPRKPVTRVESSPVPDQQKNDPLQNILLSLPLLREQYSKSQPPLEPTPLPPPPPEWNDVDLRVSRQVMENEEQSGRNPSPPRDMPRRSKSPYRSKRSQSPRRRSRSPRRRRRSRTRSPSLQSDMSISPPSSRSSSYSQRESKTSRRRRSRSRSSERSRSRRSSPRRHSPSISPSRKHSRR